VRSLQNLAVRFAAKRLDQATLGPAVLDKDCGSWNKKSADIQGTEFY
jgi:hypothetical protein